MENIRLGIVEDGPVIRENVLIFLREHPSIQIDCVAESIEDFLEQNNKPGRPALDILLLDVGLPGKSGIEGIPLIRAIYPNLNIVMLTTYEEDDVIFSALCAGACAYISKRTPLSQIRDAVFTVARGGSYMSPSIARKVVEHFMPKAPKPESGLTPRQREIVQGLVNGLSYKMIAAELDISIDTVRDHIRKIYRLLNVNSKMEVVKKSLDGEI